MTMKRYIDFHRNINVYNAKKSLMSRLIRKQGNAREEIDWPRKKNENKMNVMSEEYRNSNGEMELKDKWSSRQERFACSDIILSF